MNNPIEKAFISAVVATVKNMNKRRSNQNVVGSASVKGILINRDPPITVGWCGNDNCEHLTHKQRRAAQAGADKRSNK